MSAIELSDSIGARQIPAPSLPGTIRIELGTGDGPRVLVTGRDR